MHRGVEWMSKTETKFNSLEKSIELTLKELDAIKNTLEGKSSFARAFELTKTALHAVTQLQLELARCKREFAEVKELMQ